MSEGSSEDKTAAAGLWSQLPSFDPSVDDIREFTQKVRFLHGVFPAKDKGNLAPRLAMMCRGTAWSQVRQLDPTKLTDPDAGVNYLLDALSMWEETSELKTFELFEKALYKVVQKNDEANHSYALRLQAAFNDLGDKVSVKDMQAFVLLRQSGLTNEDKKRVLSMTQGKLDIKEVEKAMRSLSTRVLFSSGDVRKKVYPTHYVESEENVSLNETEPPIQSTYHTITEEEDALSAEILEQMVQQGDEDAMVIQQFEKDFEDMMQEVPDLQSALLSYQEARQRINDRRRSRGFWPSKGKGKGFNRDFHQGKGPRKGGARSGKDELLSRISRTHCKNCGALGHWKAECPLKRGDNKEQANLVVIDHPEDDPPDLPQVIFEEHEPDQARLECFECCFVVHSKASVPNHVHGVPVHVRQVAAKFLESRMHKYHKLGIGKTGVKEKGSKGEPQAAAVATNRNTAVPAMGLKFLTNEAECLTSQSASLSMKASGLAILDTGASRSVIGSEHVAAVLQKLPPAVQCQVREVPSRIGFRFGNNQIAYSFKQLRIPLTYGKQKIWLLIEVVPKATPVLLSIKTMKSLRATIDLGKSTCFLQKLNRSLPLKENSNGLFVIDVADLCEPTTNATAAAFSVSSICLSAPPGLEPIVLSQHADSPGDPRGVENAFGGSDGEPPNPVLHAVCSDTSHQSERECIRGRGEPDLSPDRRGEEPKAEDQRIGEHHHEQFSGPSESIQWTVVANTRRKFRHLGTDGRRVERQPESGTSSRDWTTGPKFFHADAIDYNDSSEPSPNGSASSHDRWNTHCQAPSFNCNRSWNKPSGSGAQSSSCPYTTNPDQLGPKANHMGQEARRKVLPRDLRFRSRVCPMGSGKSGKPGRGNRGLRELFTDSSSTGRSLTECQSSVGTWCPIPNSRPARVERVNSAITTEEGLWLKEVYKLIQKGKNNCPQLDILEVYAYQNSQLTQVAQACGLKARRFTREDGDLSTAEGRTNLLLYVLLYRPKHLWLSPECGPWCAWNRFNAARGLGSFSHVKHVQDEARVHLRLCNLLAKIQLQSGRHIHLENPWTSSMWDQKELREFLQSTMTARLDQCMFGLKHPETSEAMQKKTRVQTSSRQMFWHLIRGFAATTTHMPRLLDPAIGGAKPYRYHSLQEIIQSNLPRPLSRG